MKRIGQRSAVFDYPPAIVEMSSVVGKKEGEGPLGGLFDIVEKDGRFGKKTWEKGESEMQRRAVDTVLQKAGLTASEVDVMFAGDLLNQCISSSFCLRDLGIPYYGLYGACSTMAESLSLAAIAVESGFADIAAALTSSHFASAERQYRLPLEYGGQRTPTAQWTATASAAAILRREGAGPYIRAITTGKVIDLGVTDANNMGAAMAPAACDTICAHLSDRGLKPNDFDLIVTGDLGSVGKQLLGELLSQNGFDCGDVLDDCGTMLYDLKKQDVHAGGSGCGCSAVVLAAHLLPALRQGTISNLLFCGTGALLSPVSTQQGESVPSVCHAVALSRERV